MTYISDRGPGVRRYRPARRRGLGDYFSDIISNWEASQSACLAQANSATAPLDASIADVAANWNPTGFYAPSDIQAAILSALALTSQATNIVGAAPRSTSDAETQINQALDTIFQQGQKSAVYTAALTDAASKGVTVINAPGFKQWVLDTMNAASNALVTATVMECNMSWLASAIIALQPYLDALGALVKKIANVIVAAGQTVLNVAGDLPQIWTIVKWGAILGGAVWLFNELGKAKRAGTSLL